MNQKMRMTCIAIAMAFSVTACSREKQEAPGVAAASEAPGQVTVASSNAAAIPIKVYKDPGCGCCKEWVKHLEENGFKVEVVDMPDLSAVKAKYGVAPAIQACHTAVVNGYTIEGHVPADLILTMLKEKPAIAGLAVPGMPAGSPGMESTAKEQYDVLTFDRAGHTTVYAQR
jgi:hypothetical protein